MSNDIYQVVVAEDEPILMRNIVSRIELVDPTFKVIGCAKNGLEALEIMEESKPSVLFTDIQMPRLSGLELIEQVTKKFPNLHIVIVSGYDVFDYARQALRYGVKDYLLKPLNKVSLSETLQRIRASLDAEKLLSKKEQLVAILNGFELQRHTEVLGDDVHQLYLCHIGNLPNSRTSHKQAQFIRRIWQHIEQHNVIAGILGEDNWWTIEQTQSNGKWLIVRGEDHPSLDPVAVSDTLLMKLKEYAFPLPVSICPMYETFVLQDLAKAADSLQQLLEKEHVFGRSQVITSPPINKSLPSTSIDIKSQQHWALLIQKGKKESIQNELRMVLEQWEEKAFPQRWVEKKIQQLIHIFHQHSILLSDIEVATMENELLDNLALAGDYQVIFTEVYATLEKFLDANGQKENEQGLLADRVEEYIRTNFVHSITIEELSSQFNFNSSYLIKIYKKHKNTTPVKYLISLRINEAIRLIKEHPELSFRNIGSIVGYPDPDYFSRIFKKETGQSLTEYKDSVMN